MPLLRKRYGRPESYTPGQIRKTAEQAGLPMTHNSYAYAMFATAGEFEPLQLQSGKSAAS